MSKTPDQVLQDELQKKNNTIEQALADAGKLQPVYDGMQVVLDKVANVQNQVALKDLDKVGQAIADLKATIANPLLEGFLPNAWVRMPDECVKMVYWCDNCFDQNEEKGKKEDCTSEVSPNHFDENEFVTCKDCGGAMHYSHTLVQL